MSDDPDDALWRELVDGVRAAVPELVDGFRARLRREGSYDARRVPDDDLERTAEESMALLIEALARPDGAVELGDLPARLGRLRARQGVALDDLVAAIRLDFPVLWSALLERADAIPGGTAVLARKADRLWHVVDAYAHGVHSGYLTERALLVEQERDEQRRLLDVLFRPGPIPEATLARLAEGLGVGRGEGFGVAAALGEGAVTLRGRIARAAAGVLQRETDFGLVAFWPDGHDAGRTRALLTDDIGCVVLDEVTGLDAVPAAAGAAVRLAELLDPADPADAARHTPRDLWPRLARVALDEHGGLPATLRAALDDARPDEAALLRETAVAYLDTGSVAQVAASLFCHRNTVLNRLRRFRELTGLDLTRPRDAALAVVAMA